MAHIQLDVKTIVLLIYLDMKTDIKHSKSVEFCRCTKLCVKYYNAHHQTGQNSVVEMVTIDRINKCKQF